MSYLSFSRDQLVNLEFALKREVVRSSLGSAFASTSLVWCNTRKYHGLFIVPQPQIDCENHILLSSLDETVIQQGQEFNLGIHQYPGDVFFPTGHKYLQSYNIDPWPMHTYGVGGVLLSKEVAVLGSENRTVWRYTIQEAVNPVTLRFRPMLAFRQVHHLGKSNSYVNKDYTTVENGVRLCMYENYTPIYLQASRKPEYAHNPDWYYNVEYIREKERGYDYTEDLYTPGYMEFVLKKGDTLYLSVGLDPVKPADIKRKLDAELKQRGIISSMEDSLRSSAKCFFVKNNNRTEVVAGFPWFGRWGRDTFIALPGLALAVEDEKMWKAVIDTMISELQGPLFPNIGANEQSAYNSVDAPLWFFWALQKYAKHTNTQSKIWKEYGEKMQIILNGFRKGTLYNIHATPEGLIWAGEEGKALTWMDAIVNGKAVTPRIGMPVEINALWYNAIMFSIEVAELAKDFQFVEEWKSYISDFSETFKNIFWDKEHGWLADCVNGSYKDYSVRPNMIIAASLPYSPLSLKIKQLVVEKVKKELLTSRGLRTLSPTDPNYKDRYAGNQEERDNAYHQGTVWPWLIGHFTEAYLNVYAENGVPFIENLYKGFEETLSEAGLGSISEVFDANPPHAPGGTVSQAWSVAEVFRIKTLLEQYTAK